MSSPTVVCLSGSNKSSLGIWTLRVDVAYHFLLDMAYASAQHIYASFYAEKRLFDWYRPDRNRVIKVLHRLAGYDLSRVDRSVIGHIYGRYVEDQHKHKSGMYYTPPEVVEYILDQLGFLGADALGKKLVNLASGSGSFLVSAARRIVEAYREYYGGAIPPEHAQQVVDAAREGLFGLDINPFSCYLAETNLLIQMLDLIKSALEDHRDVQVERFNIYNTDTLRYDDDTLLALKSSFPFSTARLFPEERIKGRLGEFKKGFDYVVGNPPYVRADEKPEMLPYRRDIKENHPIPEVQDVLEKKWDLFVPFVALAHYLVKTDGRLSMITSNAIETASYAQALRESLVLSQIDGVDFFPRRTAVRGCSGREYDFLSQRRRIPRSFGYSTLA